jgi:hypothetical protein
MMPMLSSTWPSTRQLCVKFEVLIAGNIYALLDMKLSILAKSYQWFGETCAIYLQGIIVMLQEN